MASTDISMTVLSFLVLLPGSSESGRPLLSQHTLILLVSPPRL
ncbi:MAG TPA: hypothetical protein VFJ58_12285 [Armatimonadota bacterium]|nr:hypothetical protein [Armatimonadota bacterium]